MIPDDAPPLAPGSVPGHNQPADMRADALAELREELNLVPQSGGKTFVERRDEIVKSASAAVIRDRATAGDAGDIIRIAGDVKKLIDARRTERSDPYREVALALKGQVDDFWHDVDEALRDLRARLKVWTDGEDARIRAQQGEQDRLMAAMRTAAAPPPPPSPAAAPRRQKIRGELGATVSQADRKVYEIVDVRKVPDIILNSPTVRDAIISVARSLSKHMPAIDGIQITTVTDNQVR